MRHHLRSIGRQLARSITIGIRISISIAIFLGGVVGLFLLLCLVLAAGDGRPRGDPQADIGLSPNPIDGHAPPVLDLDEWLVSPN